MCRKYKEAQNWLRVNHDPNKKLNNIRIMYRIIGAEQVQVNTIRINSNTRTQERSESPKSEELSPLGDKQGSSKEKGKCKASMEPITIKEIPIEKASSPYEVIQIKAKGKLMSTVIIYDWVRSFTLQSGNKTHSH